MRTGLLMRCDANVHNTDPNIQQPYIELHRLKSQFNTSLKWYQQSATTTNNHLSILMRGHDGEQAGGVIMCRKWTWKVRVPLRGGVHRSEQERAWRTPRGGGAESAALASQKQLWPLGPPRACFCDPRFRSTSQEVVTQHQQGSAEVSQEERDETNNKTRARSPIGISIACFKGSDCNLREREKRDREENEELFQFSFVFDKY